MPTFYKFVMLASAGLASHAMVLAAPSPAPKHPAPTNYDIWVKRLEKRFSFDQGPGKARLSVVITAVGGDTPQTPPKDPRVILDNRTVYYGGYILQDGTINTFQHNSFSDKGSSNPSLSPTGLERLKLLIAQLPEDGRKLPPYERRLLIQVAGEDGKLAARVYDRAKLPHAVVEILKLCDLSIGNWIPTFAPTTRLVTAPKKDETAFAAAPTQTRAFSWTNNSPLKVWDLPRRRLLKTVAFTDTNSPRQIALSPDGRFVLLVGISAIPIVDTRSWKQVATIPETQIGGTSYVPYFPQFSPDGKLLFVNTSQPALQVWDTKTWRRIKQPTQVPVDAVQYAPSPTQPRALYRTRQGAIALWDTATRKRIATLDTRAEIYYAAYSPKGNLVATVTRDRVGEDWENIQVRVWDLTSGRLARELRPLRQDYFEAVDELLWSPDGDYLLVPTRAHSFFYGVNIGVWNVHTGRHRGEFTGGLSNISGAKWLKNGQLIAGSHNSQILMWDAASALKQIKQFEKSLVSIK